MSEAWHKERYECGFESEHKTERELKVKCVGEVLTRGDPYDLEKERIAGGSGVQY